MTYDNSNPGSRPIPPMTVPPVRDNRPKTWVIAGITAVVVLGLVAWSMQGFNNTTTAVPAVNSAPGSTTGVAPSTPAPTAPTK